MRSLAWLSLLAITLTTVTGSSIIEVYPAVSTSSQDSDGSNDDTVDINEALSTIASDTILQLMTGQHLVTDFIKVKDIVNVSIVGLGWSNETVITCGSKIGLVFLNVSGLSFEGLTIDGCGLYGEEYIGDVINEINSTADLFHEVYYNVSVGMILGNVRDVIMDDVRVINSVVGIMAINIFGTSSFDYIDISNNRPSMSDCNSITDAASLSINMITAQDTLGGGFILLYTDHINTTTTETTNVTISNSNFFNNTNCGLLSSLPNVYQDSETARELGYVVTGSGGFSLLLSQFRYAVSLIVSDTNFTSNKGFYGAGMYVDQFKGSNGGEITFTRCLFALNNGLAGGASGIVYFNSPVPRDAMNRRIFRMLSIGDLQPNIVTFDDCDFMNNTARTAGGVILYSSFSELTTSENANKAYFRNAKFLHNTATESAAIMSFFDLKYSSFQPGLQVFLDSITARGNDGTTTNNNGFYDSLISSLSVNITMNGTCLFTGNQGSSILAVTTSIYMSGTISFIGNSATSGGALQILTSSAIIITEGTNLLFKDNTAAVNGGALYVSLSTPAIATTTLVDCFLWFNSVDYLCAYTNCTNPDSLNFTISFINNQASLGSAVYGSALQTCPWKRPLGGQASSSSESGIELLQERLTNKSQFVIDYGNQPLERVVNTLASTINISIAEDENSSNDSSSLFAYPGRLVQFNATALDKLNQSIPLAVTSLARRMTAENSSSTADIRSQLGLSGYWFLQGSAEPENIQMYLYGKADNDDNKINVTLYSTSGSIATAHVIIMLDDCPYGFDLTTDSDTSLEECQCLPYIEDNSRVRCDTDNNAITVLDNYWLGPITTPGQYYGAACIYNYCSEGNRVIDFTSEEDPLCALHRKGVLCGQCQDGYSRVFGTNECSKCGNDVIWLLFIYLIMGVALMGLISFLDFTVAHGYINLIIFFANIVGFLIPSYADYNGGSIIFIFISLINFDTGISTCIYHEMDSLGRVGLSLMFPLYLFILMFIMMLAARRFHRLSRSPFSAPKGFATLLLLCYSTVFKTCVDILGYVKIKSSTGDEYVGWRIDPSVEYGTGAHGFLIFVAIFFLLFYIIPFSLMLLPPPFIWSKTKCGDKLRIKFLPIFDAFWNPFRVRYSFWPGLRCILRLVPYVIFAAASYPESAFSITLFVSIFMLIHFYTQPFKKAILNKIETALLFILMFLCVGTLYYPLSSQDSIASLYVVVAVLIVYIIFSVTFVLHLRVRFPGAWINYCEYQKRFLRAYLMCPCCCCCCKKKGLDKEEAVNEKQESVSQQIIESKGDDFGAILKPNMNAPRLRESLLESVTYSEV